MESATFAAGCFWGTEVEFGNVPGVVSTTVGYTGGHTKNPTYPEVCQGDTGHTEAVMVSYGPQQVSYEQLLKIFWSCHNPTRVNRQGPDTGYQYRSAIFFHTEAQQASAQSSMQQLEESQCYNDLIATAIEPTCTFFKAEKYHQK